MRTFSRCIALFAVTSALGCGQSATNPLLPCDGDICELRGRVSWMNFEGGFFAIRGDDDVLYDTHNLPGEFKHDGLRVSVNLRRRPDLGCFHMAGTIADVLDIRRL